MICDIDGVRLIGLHSTDAAGMLVNRFGPMRAGAAVVPFAQRRRRRAGISGTGTVIDLAAWRHQVEDKTIEVRQCISQ
ncbi:hypothetical protein [Martelella soudanensis]|uniref:hypothetical protein n=1 Tax=unclassified Martelella TaxID=2629616 RepID=UPI0015DF9EA1|nr:MULTISPECIES: hypothetical protein [unclassified Martelella]